MSPWLIVFSVKTHTSSGISRKRGREKLHFLNPVPIRQIHDRWIDKYREREVSALLDLKTSLEDTA